MACAVEPCSASRVRRSDAYHLVLVLRWGQYQRAFWVRRTWAGTPLAPARWALRLETVTTWSRAAIWAARPSRSAQLSKLSSRWMRTPQRWLTRAISSRVSPYWRETKVAPGRAWNSGAKSSSASDLRRWEVLLDCQAMPIAG